MFFTLLITVGFVILISPFYNKIACKIKHFWYNNKYINGKFGQNTKKNFALDKIVIADTLEKCEYAVQYIQSNLSYGVLGFDCEWVNENPVSLLQLATFNGVCVLFRLDKIGFVPPNLKVLLSNKCILKVGVEPFEDGKKLTKDYGCRVFGTLDLRKYADHVNIPNEPGLASLCMNYLGIEMNKFWKIRCSDWNSDVLTDEQISYAASDAIASIQIYHEMQVKTKQKYGILFNFYSSFIDIIKRNFFKKNKKNFKTNFFHEIPYEILDVKYHARSSKINKNNVTGNKTVKIKQQQVSKISSIPTRKESLYNHCHLQAPDGELLCIFDRKKGNWYVSKGLGKTVSEDPFTVRLNFEPVSRGFAEVDKYYTQVRTNQCVVCGSFDNFIKKNIVPREYRKYFPLVMKVHQSHDILLLCSFCHVKSNASDQDLRKELARMCNAPFNQTESGSQVKKEQQQKKRKFLLAINALKDTTIPQNRREELESQIRECTQGHDFDISSTKQIHEIIKLINESSSSEQEKTSTHGLQVVKYFTDNEGGLVSLEKMWREHFLKTMEPQYLPPLWSVSHNQERLEIRQVQNRIGPEDAKVAGIKK
ncbi:hypothetical protein HCN44_009812 [Aphidius gifuensis]|uniref:3'-5' exonuclease domain-containing protein n=1 Tax=Aphidius gifuensis TaxID=684658 RepID=A0A835CVT6_APHGI|nr:exonuclease 3'-5' domain-containing protein 2-like [Aphidius gifuensis]XP_044002749.1 exonuclease 3'-5' domain-containing protein 2-like [Aphidius gifuensis]KAF7998414.1 hypothetical protein HCN44_009812 [Aphidius gifuensis]